MEDEMYRPYLQSLDKNKRILEHFNFDKLYYIHMN